MKTITVGILTLLCAGIISSGASAMPLGVGSITAERASSLVQQIDTRHRYGEQWRGLNYNHHWGWYGWPSGFGLSLPFLANRYYGDHVEYCLNQHHSYDPNTNIYIGSDGLRHECIGDDGNGIVISPTAAEPCVKTNVTNLKNACPM
jgi:BA14K-like protein